MPRDGAQVNGAIRGTADGRVNDDGIFKRLTGHHLAWRQPLVNHVDDALAGAVRHLSAFTVRSRDRSTARKRHTQRLGERIHRERRPHRIAVSHALGGGSHLGKILLDGDFTLRHLLASFPNHRSGSG